MAEEVVKPRLELVLGAGVTSGEGSNAVAVLGGPSVGSVGTELVAPWGAGAAEAAAGSKGGAESGSGSGLRVEEGLSSAAGVLAGD